MSLPNDNILHFTESKKKPEQDFKTHGHYNKVKGQDHIMMLYNPQPMSLPSIKFLVFTVSEILPGQNFKGQGHYGKVTAWSNGKFNSKLNFYKLIPYLVDRCICPALCQSCQMLEKNVLSWALAGTGSSVRTQRCPAGPRPPILQQDRQVLVLTGPTDC